VHDFYRRFLKPGETERHYVLVGRLTTAGLMVCAALLTFALDTASESFNLILSIGAGTGLIYILRWFWWRINAWSEIAAMVSSFLIAVAFFVAEKRGMAIPSHVSLLITVALTTAVWVTVTLATKPTDRGTLVKFYRLVRPAGHGWDVVRAEAGVGPSPDSIAHAMLGWVLGCTFVYSALFGAGSFLYGRTTQGFVWLVLFVIATVGLVRLLPSLWRASKDRAARAD
jgi:Na+/proline symporter